MVSNYDNERNRPQNIYTNDNNNSEGKDPYWNSKDKKIIIMTLNTEYYL